MKLNKIIGFIAAITIITSGTVFAYREITTEDDVKLQVEEYKPAPQKQEVPEFKINRYENIDSIGWINDREMLIKIKKQGYSKRPEILYPYVFYEWSYYLGIYNPDTGSIKEFKDVTMSDFSYSISPDKQYIFYREYKDIPPADSDKWKEEYKSGRLLNYKMKILNLSTGEIWDLKTRYKNSDSRCKWVSNDLIIISYSYEKVWEIINTKGEVQKSGPLVVSAKEIMYFAGADIKTSNNELSGLIYFRVDISVKGGTNSEIVSVDINSKKKQTLKKINAFCQFIHANGVNLLGLYPASIDQNATLQWLDAAGTVKKEYSLDFFPGLDIAEGTQSSVSPDGKVLALATQAHKAKAAQDNKTADDPAIKSIIWSGKLSLLELATGNKRDVLECGSIENISWNPDGNTICFSSKINHNAEPATYVVSFK